MDRKCKALNLKTPSSGVLSGQIGVLGIAPRRGPLPKDTHTSISSRLRIKSQEVYPHMTKQKNILFRGKTPYRTNDKYIYVCTFDKELR